MNRWPMMGWAILAVAALMPSLAVAAEQTGLDGLLRANRWPVTVSAQGLGGPGAEKIQAWADEAQFFMLGEDHGSAGLARFATALSRTLGPRGYRHTAIEVDPLMTAKVTAALRGGKQGLTQYLATDQRELSLPFFSWSEEADFLASALEFGPVWGLDQSFIGAAHVHLEEIAALSTSRRVRDTALAMAKEARAKPLGFLGSVDIARLQMLRAVMPADETPAARDLAEQLIASSVIYEPFVRGQGSRYAANFARETMMKRYFQAAFLAAERGGAKSPKVLLKFGANHLQRGLSTTRVPALGNFLAEYAFTMIGKPVFNLSMLCGPGGEMASFQGDPSACDERFQQTFGPISPYLMADGATLFDLRPLRDAPALWQAWPQEFKEWVWSYDAIVVVKGGGPAQSLVVREQTRNPTRP